MTTAEHLLPATLAGACHPTGPGLDNVCPATVSDVDAQSGRRGNSPFFGDHTDPDRVRRLSAAALDRPAEIGRAVYAPVMDDPARRHGNDARYASLSPAAPNHSVDRDQGCSNTVAGLRLAAGKNPRDTDLNDLNGELNTRSEDFSRRWATHSGRSHRSGIERRRHPLAGDPALSLTTSPADARVLPTEAT